MNQNNNNLGLSQQEANERLAKYGPNQIPEAPLPGPISIFFRQFLSPFIYILLIAAIVSFMLGQNPSGVFIVAVLFVNAIIGTVQEYNAQKSAVALKNMIKGSTHVIRDGEAQTIEIEAVVPGDVVILSSGDKIPADLCLTHSHDLAVDESMLTGESLAVTKSANKPAHETQVLTERTNECFAGSIVTHGRGQGVVQATGLKTEIGSIAKTVGRQRTTEPPLLIRTRRFTYHVAAGIFVAIALLAGLMLLQGGYTTQSILLMTIGLAVSTIPEGLPAALTVALAIGMRRMARLGVIIRKLIAVEALGSCTFICSDKTGTLTVNELTIREVVLPDGCQFQVSGEGVAPGGEIVGSDTEQLKSLCVTGVLANESYLNYAGGEWVSDGDIVDVAFLVLAKKLGLSLSQINNEQEQIDSTPYESQNAYSASLNKNGDGACLYVKGSPEKILSLSSKMLVRGKIVDIDKATIQAQFEQLAKRGYRIIALAHKSTQSQEGVESLNDMVFLGMVAMIDPLRSEAREAIERCLSGGIDVAMITGDHPATAKAIGVELGLCSENQDAVSGQQIRDAAAQGTTQLDELISKTRIFARIEPQQKELIVKSLIRNGHFVAVTGDGVNDALAMREANVGIAMGKRGTDVAKETADLIITDDNFASIVNGIEQGRVIYNNIRKVIALLIATGYSAIFLFFGCVIFGLPMPLIAVQLLWLNLVANGLQDVALAFEPKEGHELDSKPRDPKEPIFERRIIEHVLITGTVMGTLALFVFNELIKSGESLESARNLVLMLMVLFGNIHALSSRSETQSLFTLRFFANPFLIIAVPMAQLIHIGATYLPGLSDVLQLEPVSFAEWAWLLMIALSLFVVEETHKAWLRFKLRKRKDQGDESEEKPPTTTSFAGKSL